ncbi:MAG: TIM barrel protein [Bacteroidota bacterium]|nr:TIM barrel protein [Bacteroidota bacterium]
MERRKFIQSGLLTGLSVGIGGATLSSPVLSSNNRDGKPFNMNYAPHDGMFKNNAGNDFIDQIKFMHDQGFNAIEDNGMPGRPVEQQTKIGDTLAKLGMDMGVFVLDKGGNGANSLAAGKPEYIDIFLKGCRQAVEIAKRTNAKWVNVVPGDFERHLPIGIQTANVIESLRRGVEILEPHGLIIILEPLSDTPNLFLRSPDQAYMICKAVNSPFCKFLYDIYHMQRNMGNLITHIDECWDEIAYYQIGDVPGRKEPTTGEINYKNIFKHLHEKGYKGILGMEHGISKPGKEGEMSLIKTYREVDSFI